MQLVYYLNKYKVYITRNWNMVKLLIFNWNILQGNGCFLRKVRVFPEKVLLLKFDRNLKTSCSGIFLDFFIII